MTAARAYMTARAGVGTLWRRRRDRTLWRIVQSHRKDRIAVLVPDQALPLALAPDRAFVSFDDLREHYEEVPQP